MSDRTGSSRGAPHVGRRRCVRGVGAAALALCLTVPLAAQNAASGATARAADARATAIRDRFVRAAGHAAHVKAMIDSSLHAQSVEPVPDSIIAGTITIRIRGEPLIPGFREALVSGAATAWSTAVTTLGSEASLASGHPLTVVRIRKNIWDPEPLAVLQLPGKVPHFFQFSRTPQPQQLTDAVLDLVGWLAGEREPTALKGWTGAAWIPLKPNAHDEWELAGFALATSRSSYARRCFEGAIRDCAVVMELTPDRPADPLRAWYRSEDIPELVSEYTSRDSSENALFRRCVLERNADVCDSAARLRAIRYPLSVSIKNSLVAFAVERGGQGAFTRLLHTDDATSTILAATAGVPLDQLLAEWRIKAVAAAPARSMPGPLEGGTVLLWAVALAALATRRRP